MSQENVEMLCEAYELLNTRFAAFKGGEIDDLLAFFDPEVVIEMVDAPDPETYHGHDGVRRWFNDAFGPWAAVHIEAEDFKETGQWTVALLRTSLRGEASGVELELSTAAFHQFRGGRIVLDRVYLDRDEGLQAFALKEQAMSQQNVELVTAAIDAVNREDWDAAFQDAAPGFELDMSRGLGLMKGVYGLDQARPLLAEFARHWEAVWIEPHEFIEAGDLLVVPQTTHGEGRDGIEVVSRPTLVWTIRDGAIERICMYQERQDALESVGLAE